MLDRSIRAASLPGRSRSGAGVLAVAFLVLLLVGANPGTADTSAAAPPANSLQLDGHEHVHPAPVAQDTAAVPPPSPVADPAPAVHDHGAPAMTHDHGAPSPSPVADPAPAPAVHDHGAPSPVADPAPAPAPAVHDHGAPSPVADPAPAVHDHAAPAPAVHDHGAPAMTHDHGAPSPSPVADPAPAPSAHDHGAPAPVAAPSAHDHGAPAPVAAPSAHDHGAPAPVAAPSAHDHGAPASSQPAADSHGGHSHAAPVMGEHGEHDAHGAAQEGHTMTHPGLPQRWIFPALGIMGLMILFAVRSRPPEMRPTRTLNLATVPVFGILVRFLNASPWPLAILKIFTVSCFLLVVFAGLFGTDIPERNLATVFVWNYWWPLVVVSVLFVGSSWCAICPWDNLASWLIRRRLWRRSLPHPGFNLKVPAWLRNVYPALILLMGLTWLELGVGVTTQPRLTAILALVMVFLSLISLYLFERKAFCRYFCPVGRNMGCYSRLGPIEVRPQNEATCTTCKTMECYNGSALIEPCPTHLTVGRFSQNTYCISCGNCVLSCPHDNVSWRLRTMGSEAKAQARPLWDGSWFMLAMLGITSFHGVTMMSFWQDWVFTVARWIGESGQLIFSFTLLMLAGFVVPILFYALAIGVTRAMAPSGSSYKRLFLAMAFGALPLAFVYHLAHNLDHLFREGGDVFAMALNPLGIGVAAMTAAERHGMMMQTLFPEEALFGIQTALMLLGFWLSVQIMRHRAIGVLAGGGTLQGNKLLPMVGFAVLITGFNFWLLSHEMVMRF
ncbi:MAG: hypothetical protein HQL91_09125 [Magnetococcales bacterium]|nr:hypothetical protein [Magnetococcales bacterium]